MLRACLGEPVDRPPVWLMRQAGRVLPEYRAIKERSSFLEMCGDPEIATDVSLQPFRRFGMDGVVVFSDILLPLQDLGVKLSFNPSPVVANPIEGTGDLDRIEGSVEKSMASTCQAIRLLKRELGDRAAVIGFAGAPWTLAAYACERSLSRDIAVLSQASYAQPRFVQELLDRLAKVTADTLQMQIDAGADVLQIFDTWAGMLSAPRFKEFAGRALRDVIQLLPADRPPVIVFARGAAHLVDELADLGAEVVSLDWRTDFAQAVERIGQRVSLQGNLEPTALAGSAEQITRSVNELARIGRGARGHILNLGHGLLPSIPIEGVAAFVKAAQNAGGYSGTGH